MTLRIKSFCPVVSMTEKEKARLIVFQSNFQQFHHNYWWLLQYLVVLELFFLFFGFQIFSRCFESRETRTNAFILYEWKSRAFSTYSFAIRWFTRRESFEKWHNCTKWKKKDKKYYVIIDFLQLLFRLSRTNNGEGQWSTLVWSQSLIICLRSLWCFTRIQPKIQAARNDSTSNCTSVPESIVVYKRICHRDQVSDLIRATNRVTIL